MNSVSYTKFRKKYSAEQTDRFGCRITYGRDMLCSNITADDMALAAKKTNFITALVMANSHISVHLSNIRTATENFF